MTARITPAVLPEEHIALKSSRYALGLVFILLQCVVWILAAVITQSLYDDNLAPPFLLTYIGMSMLAVSCLPIQYAKEKGWICQEKEEEPDENDLVDLSSVASADTLDVHFENAQSCSDYVGVARISAKKLANDHSKQWNYRKHVTAALFLAPAMFGADYFFNKALYSTSVASATVLVSTQSVFVLVLAVFQRLEVFSCLKLLGVLAGVAGTAFTALDDTQDDADGSDMAIRGDIYAVLAAVLYATYTIQVRMFCPEREELYSMPLLLGLIGLVCAVGMAPYALYLAATDVPWSLRLIGLILTKGFMDFAITDYCLFRAIILTNATIATVGLGLTIPMAFAADLMLGKMESVTALSVAGAVAVAVGFLVVNLAPQDQPPVGEGSETMLEKEQPAKNYSSVVE